MADHTKTSPQPSLFARKGEAAPAPAVAYVSLRQMQGKSEQRGEEPDRREQWETHQHDGESSDRRTHLGPDHDGRRHFTPRTGLAFGQRYVPWASPEADASQEPARKRKAKKTVGPLSVASLSALIHRHRDGFAQSASRAPVPAPAPAPVAREGAATASPATPAQDSGPATPAQARAAADPTKVEMPYLSAAGASGGRPAAQTPPAAPQAAKPPTDGKRKKKRKKVTVRLDFDQFQQIKELADRAGKSYQKIMAKAVANYLKKIS